MNYMDTDVSTKLSREPDGLVRRGDAAAAAPAVKDLFQVLAVPPAPAETQAGLHQTNLLMAELFMTALGVDHEVRFSGTPAWTSLCRTISFGMALDLLELCKLRELGLHGDRNDRHFDADKIAALIRQVNDISKYSSRSMPVVGWPLEELACALADLLGPAGARTEVWASIDHVRMPPVQAHVVSIVALRLFLAILRRRYETRAAGPVGLSVTKAADEVTLIVTDHACRGGYADDALRKWLMRLGASIDAGFVCRTPNEYVESITMRFNLPR